MQQKDHPVLNNDTTCDAAFRRNSLTSCCDKCKKNCRCITTCKAHNWHIYNSKNSFWHVKGRGYNTQFLLYPRATALDMPKRIFAVLYVSVMGFTRCYKTTVFYIYICSFSTKFISQMYTIAQAYLRCCKNERKPYWNRPTTCGFNLVIVVINTSFADAK